MSYDEQRQAYLDSTYQHTGVHSPGHGGFVDDFSTSPAGRPNNYNTHDALLDGYQQRSSTAAYGSTATSHAPAVSSVNSRPSSPRGRRRKHPGTPGTPGRGKKRSASLQERVSKYRNALVGLVVLAVVVFVGGIFYLRHLHPHDMPETSSETNHRSLTGWVSVVGAIIIFGSYGILIKDPAVQEARVDTMVFQLYYSSGVVLSSLIVLAVEPFVFSYWGIVGAVLWVVSQLAAYLAIYGLGYAVALAIWAGLTIVVSFLWGAIAFDQKANYGGAAIGLFCLVLGITGIALCETEFPSFLQQWVWGGHPPENETRVMDATASFASDSEDYYDEEEEEEEWGVSRTTGFLSACTVGLCNGSLMVPFHYYQNSDSAGGAAHDIAYLTSLALGIAIVTPACFVVYALRQCCYNRPIVFHFRAAAAPGFVTGIFWAAGNFCATYATEYLGDTLGYPLTQVAVGVAGLWGVLYYKEITGSYAIGFFCVSLLLLFGGCVILALFTGS